MSLDLLPNFEVLLIVYFMGNFFAYKMLNALKAKFLKFGNYTCAK